MTSLTKIYEPKGFEKLITEPLERKLMTLKDVKEIISISKDNITSFMVAFNLDAERDWGYAPEYVEAMWLMLQQEEPSDLVIATGETHSVREFIEKAFKIAGYTIYWEGSGIDEVGKCSNSNDVLVFIDPYYFRPTEVEILHGNPSKAEKLLGWKAKIDLDTGIKQLIKLFSYLNIKKFNNL